MDRSEDHYPWPHGMASYYSTQIFNVSKLPLPPSNSYINNHHQNYNALRCPEPRRPYQHYGYPPFKYYHDSTHDNRYYSNTAYPQEFEQYSNYYSSYRVSGCEDCSPDNTCYLNKNRSNSYQNNCTYNYANRSDINVRQFWATWQDKDEENEQQVEKEEQSCLFQMETVPLDCTSRAKEKYCENIPDVLGFSAIPSYSTRNDFNKTENGDSVPFSNFKNSEISDFNYHTKGEHQNTQERRHVICTPYLSERSHYNITSSLESDEHFDDINTRNEERRKTMVHPIYHQESGHNLQNNKTLHSTQLNNDRTIFWKNNEEIVQQSIDDYENVSVEKSNGSENSKIGFKNESNTKNKNVNFFQNETLSTVSSMSNMEIDCEKCKFNEEISSEDIDISIASSGELVSNSTINPVNNSEKIILQEKKSLKDNCTGTDFINKRFNEEIIQKNEDNSAVSFDQSEDVSKTAETKDKVDSASLNVSNPLQEEKFDGDYNKQISFEKMMCDVETQVHLCDFKYTKEVKTSRCLNFLEENGYSSEDSDKDLNFYRLDVDINSKNLEAKDSINQLHYLNNSLPDVEKENIHLKFKPKNHFKKSKLKLKRNKNRHEEKFRVSRSLETTEETLDTKISLRSLEYQDLNNIDMDDVKFPYKSESEIEDSDLETDLELHYKESDNVQIVESDHSARYFLDKTLKSDLTKDENGNHAEMNDNLLLLAHCSQEYRLVHKERIPLENKDKKMRKNSDSQGSLKCRIGWDKIFSTFDKQNDGDLSLDLGPAKVELRLPTNCLHVKPQWKVVGSEENRTITSSIVNVKRLILKRKLHFKEKIPKMVIKRNDDKEYISYLKNEGTIDDTAEKPTYSYCTEYTAYMDS